jgi:archaellum component FlaC
MSSRSLAAARSRRAGENPPPVSGNRPGTSIGGQSAFSQQQNPYQPSSNVRVARQGQPTQFHEQPQQNKMPFNKISVSDAIGLVTLRLGRVEQYIIESEHEKEANGSSEVSGGGIDSSILNNMISRLDSLEKREPTNTNAEDLTKLTEQLTRIGDECNKHTLAIAKNTEQLFRFERELTETKDILKTFMIKYDNFAQDTNTRFVDFETALTEIEKNIPIIELEEQVNASSEVTDSNVSETGESTSIMSAELKNMIKQEFSTE